MSYADYILWQVDRAQERADALRWEHGILASTPRPPHRLRPRPIISAREERPHAETGDGVNNPYRLSVPREERPTACVVHGCPRRTKPEASRRLCTQHQREAAREAEERARREANEQARREAALAHERQITAEAVIDRVREITAGGSATMADLEERLAPEFGLEPLDVRAIIYSRARHNHVNRDAARLAPRVMKWSA